MRQFKRTSISIAAMQVVLAWPLAAAAQSDASPAPAAPASAASQPAATGPDAPAVVVVTGQRRALQTAQNSSSGICPNCTVWWETTYTAAAVRSVIAPSSW